MITVLSKSDNDKIFSKAPQVEGCTLEYVVTTNDNHSHELSKEVAKSLDVDKSKVVQLGSTLTHYIYSAN